MRTISKKYMERKSEINLIQCTIPFMVKITQWIRWIDGDSQESSPWITNMDDTFYNYSMNSTMNQLNKTHRIVIYGSCSWIISRDFFHYIFSFYSAVFPIQMEIVVYFNFEKKHFIRFLELLFSKIVRKNFYFQKCNLFNCIKKWSIFF